MKYIAKMMLALLVSVTMAAQAYAWDFSASGSAAATFDMTTTKPKTGESQTTQSFASASGGVSLKSAHADGDNSYTLSYTADVDTDGTQSSSLEDTAGSAGLDQTLSLAASKKVGKWTASATASQSLMEDSVTRKISADDDTVITLTDGSMTYKLGDASHLSTAEKTSATTASGTVDAEARVDGFNGFSVGMAVGPGALTVALNMDHGTGTTLMGDQSTAIGCGGQHTGFGFNFAGNVGADLSLTYASGSSAADKSTCTGDNSSLTASANTMGLGVAIPMGTMTIALDYEASNTTSTGEVKTAVTGYEVSASIGGIADGTVVVNVSGDSTKVGEGDAVTRSGLEAGWKVPIGPTTLEVAYGSVATTNGADDGKSVTDIEIEMSFSF
jgi:hypothetical protein